MYLRVLVLFRCYWFIYLCVLAIMCGFLVVQFSLVGCSLGVCVVVCELHKRAGLVVGMGATRLYNAISWFACWFRSFSKFFSLFGLRENLVVDQGLSSSMISFGFKFRF